MKNVGDVEKMSEVEKGGCVESNMQCLHKISLHDTKCRITRFLAIFAAFLRF